MLSVTPTFASARRRHPAVRIGFSLTELLVVIGIIVLLVGLLLVALGQVQAKARRTQTEAVMNQFMNAATTYQGENGEYPGVIPEVVLATNAGGPQITSTENALLALMGGFRVLRPTDPRTAGSAAFDSYEAYRLQALSTNSLVGNNPITWATPTGDWDLVIDARKLGEGPIINGKPHAPYFTPGASDTTKTDGHPELPELIDAWGQPIVYLRQLRDRGPLVEDAGNTPAPQYLTGGILPYVMSTSLGELQSNQMDANRGSIFNTGPGASGSDISYVTLARILEHAAIAGQTKGAMCLISAGKDGIYYSRADGPGSEGNGVDDIVTPPPGNPNGNPKVVDDYDDVRIFGGA